MIPISYTITPAITDHLVAIDSYRRAILLTPVSPRTEQKLRWIADIDHMTGSLSLSQPALTKSHISAIITHASKHPSSQEQLVLAYKRALDYIRDSWAANPEPISFSTFETLGSIILPARTIRAALQKEEANIRHLLTYLQSHTDHPFLIAGVAQGQIASSPLYTLSHGLICRLTTTLILAKYGYNCRGMLALDTYWSDDRVRYDRALSSISRTGQMTAWLEYFTAVAESASEDLSHKITQSGERVMGITPAAVWQLTQREEQIIHRLDAPTSHITNRDVQHSFHVSQVTASRDLTRLAALGLLFAHGKGRSVYYTRA